MVGNDIVVIPQMSLLVVVHLLSRCRPSGHQGKNENYGVSDSSQQGYKCKLWCCMLFLCALIIFARVQQSDPWSYLNPTPPYGRPDIILSSAFMRVTPKPLKITMYYSINR